MRLGEYVDRVLVDGCFAVDDVARVITLGLARPAMRRWLNPGRRAPTRLTTSDGERALRAQNVERPAGRIETQKAKRAGKGGAALPQPAE